MIMKRPILLLLLILAPRIAAAAEPIPPQIEDLYRVDTVSELASAARYGATTVSRASRNCWRPASRTPAARSFRPMENGSYSFPRGRLPTGRRRFGRCHPIPTRPATFG
jgi:hypothetical protein